MSIDVVITDIQLRESDGIELTRLIGRRRRNPGSDTGIGGGLAGHPRHDLRGGRLSAQGQRARGHPVGRGGRASGRAGTLPRGGAMAHPGLAGPRLTRRESDVLRLVAKGAANKEIADLLQLGDKTVRQLCEPALSQAGHSGPIPAELAGGASGSTTDYSDRALAPRRRRRPRRAEG